MKFEADEFVLEIPGDWEFFEGEDPEEFSFHSAGLKASIVISYLHAQVPRDKMLAAAQAVIASRMSNLNDAGPIQVDETIVEMLDEEGMAHARHTGETGTGVFRFESWVTEAKVINLWVGVEDKAPERAMGIFDDIFGGFSFYVP
jgi:hypothetical protein